MPRVQSSNAVFETLLDTSNTSNLFASFLRVVEVVPISLTSFFCSSVSGTCSYFSNSCQTFRLSCIFCVPQSSLKVCSFPLRSWSVSDGSLMSFLYLNSVIIYISLPHLQLVRSPVSDSSLSLWLHRLFPFSSLMNPFLSWSSLCFLTEPIHLLALLR